jgi:tetratricopeptide (TPR) repeat protein
VKRLYLAVLSLILAVQIGMAQDASSNAKSPEAGNAYNNGIDLAKKGDFKAAIPKFKEAVAADPNFHEAYYMLGYAQKKTKDFTGAETSYKKAIEANSKFEKAFIALGNLQTQLEEYDAAINSFNAIIAFNDQSARAYFGVGNVYYKKKNYSSAVNSLTKAVELDGNYDPAWNILGLSQEQTNQLSDAAVSFDSAIKATKKNARKGSYYYRLAAVLVKLKKFNEAETAYLNALKFSKSQSIIGGSNFGLGDIYKRRGQNQKALEYFRKASRNRDWKAAADYEIDMIQNPDKYAY